MMVVRISDIFIRKSGEIMYFDLRLRISPPPPVFTACLSMPCPQLSVQLGFRTLIMVSVRLLVLSCIFP